VGGEIVLGELSEGEYAREGKCPGEISYTPLVAIASSADVDVAAQKFACLTCTV